MRPRLSFALLLPALATLAIAAPLADPYAPIAASAIHANGGALVAWVPAAAEAEAFQIYGVTDDTLSLLATVDGTQTQASVTGVFDTYAVAAIVAGRETAATPAVLIGTSCIRVDSSVTPPAVYYQCEDDESGGSRARPHVATVIMP